MSEHHEQDGEVVSIYTGHDIAITNLPTSPPQPLLVAFHVQLGNNVPLEASSGTELMSFTKVMFQQESWYYLQAEKIYCLLAKIKLMLHVRRDDSGWELGLGKKVTIQWL